MDAAAVSAKFREVQQQNQELLVKNIELTNELQDLREELARLTEESTIFREETAGKNRAMEVCAQLSLPCLALHEHTAYPVFRRP